MTRPTFNSFSPSPTTLFHVLIPTALKWCCDQSWARSDLIIEFKATQSLNPVLTLDLKLVVKGKG